MSEENNEKVIKRDYSIDLIRVVACILVVATHLSLQVFNEYYHEVDWSRLIEKCFFTDGVPLFFMITGFFIINGREYKRIIKSTFFKVIIPSFIYVVFAQIFYMFIINKESFLWCLKKAFTNLNLGGILESILKADVVPINSLCAHLWYIYSYIKIILWVPIIWLLCSDDKNPRLARRMIIAFGIVGMLLVDIQKFVTFPFGNIALMQYVDRELIYVLLGYELFINKDKIKNNKKLCFGSIIAFILINIIRYKIENHYMVVNSFYNITGRDNFLEWRYTVLNVFSGISLFIFLYS
ncbi:MAG: acyltransferase, partial [Clostridia bacterium]|nr:acyltransferase [Clostridia bacterium]